MKKTKKRSARVQKIQEESKTPFCGTGNKVFFLLFHFIFPSHTVLHFLDRFFSSWIEKMCVVFDSKGMKVVGGEGEGGRRGEKGDCFVIQLKQ